MPLAAASDGDDAHREMAGAVCAHRGLSSRLFVLWVWLQPPLPRALVWDDPYSSTIVPCRTCLLLSTMLIATACHDA